MTFSFEIITPEKVVFQDEINEVTVPTTTGEITVLPNHIGLVTQIAPGELTIRKAGKDFFLAVTGGFLEVANNKASLLADYAIRSEEIEVAKAQEAQIRAEKVMQEKGTERDFALAEAQFRRAIVELKVSNRRKRI